MLGGAQGARAHQRAEGVSGGEAGVLSKCERKRRTRQRPSLFLLCARRDICILHGRSSTPPMAFRRSSGHALRRGRRSRRPVHFFRRESSAPSGAGHFWPQRPANFSLSCLRRPHFFQQRKKWGKERRQRPMVFGIPSGQFRCGGKRFRRESTASLPSLPLTWWAGDIGGTTDLVGDYQIAHLPPSAASVGAA